MCTLECARTGANWQEELAPHCNHAAGYFRRLVGWGEAGDDRVQDAMYLLCKRWASLWGRGEPFRFCLKTVAWEVWSGRTGADQRPRGCGDTYAHAVRTITLTDDVAPTHRAATRYSMVDLKMDLSLLSRFDRIALDMLRKGHSAREVGRVLKCSKGAALRSIDRARTLLAAES